MAATGRTAGDYPHTRRHHGRMALRASILAIAVTSTLALAGCSSAPSPTAAPVASTTSVAASPTPSPTPSPSSVAPRSFATPDALVAELPRAGMTPCIGYEAIDKPTGAKARGRCSVAGYDMVVSTYASHADAVGAFEEMAATMAGSSAVHMAIGVNWTLNGDDADYVQRVAKAFGGEYRTT